MLDFICQWHTISKFALFTTVLTPLDQQRRKICKTGKIFKFWLVTLFLITIGGTKLHCKQNVATIYHRRIADELVRLAPGRFCPILYENAANLKMAVKNFPQTFGRCIGAHFFYFSIQIIDQVRKKPFRKVVTELRFLTQL